MSYTHVVLIPKINEPKHVFDYRPISLGNVVSRIVSKNVVSRIVSKVLTILPNVISDSQSAFVPNQLITNNTTVAFEVLRMMWNKITGKKGQMTIKLDISKAYNQVEWAFPWEIIKTGVRCSVGALSHGNCSYSNIFDAHKWRTTGVHHSITWDKTRRPFSPHLFLLCVEGLSSLIRKAMETQ